MNTQPCNYTNFGCIGCKAYRKEKGIPEPDPNAAYNDNLHRNSAVLNQIFQNAPEGSDVFELMARAMVANMAESFCDGAEWGREGYGTNKELIERGLIPAKPDNNA